MTWEELTEKLKELSFTPDEVYFWMEKLNDLKEVSNENRN